MTFTNGDFVYTTFDSPLDNYNFISLDDALAQLTEVYEQFEYVTSLYQRSDFALNDIIARLNSFVKENHGATDASALIEALCDEFSIDSTRRITATINVQFTVAADVPYTKTIDEAEEDFAGFDFRANLGYAQDYDSIDVYVEDVSVEYIEED